MNYECGQLICVSLVFSNTPESEVFRFHFNPAGSNKFLVFNLPIGTGLEVGCPRSFYQSRLVDGGDYPCTKARIMQKPRPMLDRSKKKRAPRT